jgi:hypothetical protein
MKFDCGLTETSRIAKVMHKTAKLNIELSDGGGWKKYFLWFPVTMKDNDCRWLEWVERRPAYYEAYAYTCGHRHYYSKPKASSPVRLQDT